MSYPIAKYMYHGNFIPNAEALSKLHHNETPTPDSCEFSPSYTYIRDASSLFGTNGLMWNYCELPAYEQHIRPLCTPTLRVIDAGCANGRIIKCLITLGVEEDHVIGIDATPKYVEEARSTFPRAIFIDGDIAKLHPELEGKADLITCHLVLEHLDQSQYELAMANFHSWLKPGGKLFYIEMHPDRTVAKASGSCEPGWVQIEPGWGGEIIPYFYRTMAMFLEPTIQAGFTIETGKQYDLLVSPEGEKAFPERYKKYVPGPIPRFAVLATKNGC